MSFDWLVPCLPPPPPLTITMAAKPSPYRPLRGAPRSSSFDSDEEEANIQNRAVQIIGYLPDLKPFVSGPELSENSIANNARRVAFDEDLLRRHAQERQKEREDFGQSPPQTPFLRAFESKKAFSDWFREGSVRGSVFNLCSATLGAGALALPYAFSKSGWLLGVVMLLIGAVGTVFSINMLVVARDLTGLKSYEDLTVHLFGRKMGLLVEVNIIVFCFGTAVAYLIAVGDILEPVCVSSGLGRWLAGMGAHDPWTDDLKHKVRLVAMCVFFGAIMFPLSLLEKINSLRFTSFFGVLSIFYLVFATAFHSTQHMLRLGFDESWGLARAANFRLLDFAQAMPIIMFAFTCQVNVFSIYDELERPSPRRMGKVTNYAILVCIVVYAMTGVFGSLEYHDETNQNILNNFFQDGKDSKEGQSLVILMAFVAMALTIVMAFPLVVFPCRYTMDVMLFHKSPPNWWRHFGLTAVICGLTLVVSLKVPNISVVFQLMGGTTSAFVCFVLPAAFAIHLERMQRGLLAGGGESYGTLLLAGNGEDPEKATAENINKDAGHQITRCEVVGSWILAVGGVVVGVVSTSVTIYNLVEHTG